MEFSAAPKVLDEMNGAPGGIKLPAAPARRPRSVSLVFHPGRQSHPLLLQALSNEPASDQVGGGGTQRVLGGDEVDTHLLLGAGCRNLGCQPRTGRIERTSASQSAITRIARFGAWRVGMRRSECAAFDVRPISAMLSVPALAM